MEDDRLRRKNLKPRFAAGPGLTPQTDALFSYEELAQRWNLTVFVAKRTAKKFGLPIIRLTSQSARVRLSDVLKAEQEAVINLPANFQKDFPGRAERQAARKAEVAKP